MNGRFKYKTNIYLESLGSKVMNSNQLSEALSKLGHVATPRQATNFIKQHLNHCVEIIRVDQKNGSYRNSYKLVPGALNVS